MSAKLRHRAAVSALAVGAMLSLAFAAEPAPDEASSSGKCLEGHAYVSIDGTPYGITSTGCLLPTKCTGDVAAGPTSTWLLNLGLHTYLQVPQPRSSESFTCLVAAP